MKRWLLALIIFIGLFFLWPVSVKAQSPTPISTQQLLPVCGCPTELNSVYQELGTKYPELQGQKCIANPNKEAAYAEFYEDPEKNHLWVLDPEITAQGKSNERARQFVYWTLNQKPIENPQVIRQIWSETRNISFYFLALMAALFGLGLIINQRTSYDTGIKLWPAVMKIFGSLLYIVMSFLIIMFFIQMSDLLMNFFIENLGGSTIFNTMFGNGTVSQEDHYLKFRGCRDLNYMVQESTKSEIIILNLTNLSMYLLGGMLILRKIILWFLLFVSPFLPFLLSFSLLKNVGWIWIGVFFQWVFYGPLLAMFLGGLAVIWREGVPFIFDFGRANTAAGYVYPTAINITYGGPAQMLSPINNGNFIDTFAEYVITLIMLWAVTIFPWWLLRNFRDYCCNGINAIKNMMLSNFGPGRGGSPTPSPSPVNISTNLGNALKMPRAVETTMKTRIETVEEIKKAKTEEIVHSLDIRAANISDVARFETNKQSSQNMNYLKNPTQATTASERQKYMNIRVELSNRAAKADPLASKFVSSVFAPPIEQVKNRSAIITTLPKMVPVTQVVSIKVKLPKEKVQQISSSVANMVSGNSDMVAELARKTKVDVGKAQQVLSIFHQSISDPPTLIVEKIAKETGLDKTKVTEILKEYSLIVKTDVKIAEAVAIEQNIKPQEVKDVMMAQTPMIAEPVKNIEQAVVIPQTVSIDEYEQVKKMWISQYEKGEIPTTENIKNRDSWVEKDIVTITNTLNKLFSENQELKQEGLDEVGYVLPIFMVNSLNGEQLVTYLKAKIEAAKNVKELFDKEKEITEKLKSESEKIEVSKPKVKEADKTMEMKRELKNE